MVKKWILARLKEPTTWAGIITAVAYFGVTIPEEIKPYLTEIGVSLGAMLLVLMKEGKDETLKAPAEIAATGEVRVDAPAAGQSDAPPNLNVEGQF